MTDKKPTGVYMLSDLIATLHAEMRQHGDMPVALAVRSGDGYILDVLEMCGPTPAIVGPTNQSKIFFAMHTKNKFVQPS